MKNTIRVGLAALLAVGLGHVTSPAAAATSFHVSPNGDGSDGRSWATAWQSPEQIEWQAVRPGDTIVLDGGESGVTYTGGFRVERGGVAGAPVTVRVSDEAGHNGQVVLFGGRATPLPYCGQGDYEYAQAARRGIEIKASWVVIDGGRWKGMAIHGFNTHGVMVSGKTRNVTLRNLEIFDNGSARRTSAGWQTDEEGINLAGYNHTFERLAVHDNGQDEIQGGGAVGNFTLRDSWLYNSRTHPSDGGLSFNYCRHSDGLQLWNGGWQSGVTVERSVVGPGFMQGLLLGDRGKGATINDVVIRDTLLIDATNANIHTQDTRPRNWLLERVTSIRPVGAKYHNIFFTGYGITIKDSLFTGGTQVYVPNGGRFLNNCQWDVAGASVGQKVNPGISGGAGDYRATPECGGSRITSAAQLSQ